MTRPNRVPGQTREEWSDATRAEFGDVAPAAGGQRPLHLPSVIAHHPTFLAPYLVWAKAVALAGVLPRRDAALLALRTALRCRSEFEWGVHAASAVARAGLTPDDVARVAAGPDAAGWSDREAALVRAVDELHDAHTMSDPTWAELGQWYDDAARLEIAFVVGHYTMLSLVANTAGVPPEPAWEPLPGSVPGR
ncbi:MAG TPA: carboxymuconolactone decarboxylase family protein [Acidimicrobiia bacterium]|nr:carboxymuconolactone decarboxylase family protein [Acidimicrobiia bacterium]